MWFAWIAKFTDPSGVCLGAPAKEVKVHILFLGVMFTVERVNLDLRRTLGFTSRQLRVSAKVGRCLSYLGKPCIHFFLVGNEFLDARALLQGEEIKDQTFTSRLSLLDFIGFLFRSSRTGYF
jgi:hypothetical protein